MPRLASFDELLNRTFELACFIHGDRNTAIQIATSAMGKLEVLTAAQDKRLYYKPSGRSWHKRSIADRFRNKVSFSETHMLQRLVYIESEPFEKLKEQGHCTQRATEEDLVVHFVKHLVRMTVKRNSFYVTLGLSRLLYNYSTAETMDVYNAVIQNPERVKDDYYYRSRKGVLMHELKNRFGELIKVCRGPHGEERFQAHNGPGRLVELVRESLSFFTPWYTPCVVPAEIDPIMDGIEQFSYQGHKQEDKIEVNRIHAVLHPDCYERLIRALGFAKPEERLEIPQFFLSNDIQDMNASGGDRRHPHDLEEDELRSIKKALDDRSSQRKKAVVGMLRVVVDGKEHSRVDLNSARSTCFDLDSDAEWIEVYSSDPAGPDLLLASHLVNRAASLEIVEPTNQSLVLEGGQKISIAIVPTHRDDSSHDTVKVTITYRETNPIKAVALSFRQSRNAIKNDIQARGLVWNNPAVLTAATALALGVASAFLATRYVFNGGHAARPTPVASSNQNNPGSLVRGGASPTEREAAPDRALDTPVNKLPGPAGEPNMSGTAPPRQPSIARRRDGQKSNPPPAPRDTFAGRSTPIGPPVPDKKKSDSLPELVAKDGQPDKTRGTQPEPINLSLAAVKRVFVEPAKDEALALNLSNALAENLRATSRFTVASDREEADALLKVSLVRSKGEPVSIVVRVLNTRGNVIWPLQSTASHGTYPMATENVAAQIVRDLVADGESVSKQR
jgi:hypothetical protein